jgi:hypothetical protein
MVRTAIPNLGQGLNLDGTGEELGAGIVTAGSNMRFRDGYAERRKGFASAFSATPITPYSVCHFTAGSVPYVIYAGLQKTYADDGTTLTEITNGNNTGGVNDRWSAFAFNGIYVQNNGVDVPQYWTGDTATDLINLPGWPSGYRAGWMVAFKNYIIAGDITKSGVRYPQLILTSNQADPGSPPNNWNVADPTSDALENPLADSNGALVGALPMGDALIVYKTDAIRTMQEVNSAFVFDFGALPGATGLLARGCVVDVPSIGHVLLTPSIDVVINNGQGTRSIIAGKMRTWLQENINTARAVRSFVVASYATSEVLVCFPSGTSDVCDKAIVWNWEADSLSRIDLPSVTAGSCGQVNLTGTNTWDAATVTWDQATYAWSDGATLDGVARLIFARSAPGLCMYGSGEQDIGSSFTATLERTGMHFGDPTRVKLYRGLRAMFDAADGTVIKVQVGASKTAGGTVTWKNPVNYTQGTTIQANAMTSGRFLAIRIYTTGDTPWRVRSIEMDIEPQGLW